MSAPCKMHMWPVALLIWTCLVTLQTYAGDRSPGSPEDGSDYFFETMGSNRTRTATNPNVITLVPREDSEGGNERRLPRPAAAAEAPCRFSTWEDRKRNSPLIWNRLVGESCTDIPVLKPARYAPKCKLAIIAAGMPRTGSTLMFKVLKAVLSKLRIWKGHGVQLKYWQWHLRDSAVPHRGPLEDAAAGTECNMRWQLYNSTKVQLDALNGKHIVLIKSHEFDRELLNLCESSLVFTSVRDVADVAASKIHSGWVRKTPSMTNRDWMAVLAGGIKGDLDEHQCWIRFAPNNVNVHYSAASNCGRYFFLVANALRETLPPGSVDTKSISKEAAAEFTAWCTTHEMNARFPANRNGGGGDVGSKVGSFTLSEDVAFALRNRFKDWQVQHGWSPGIAP